MSEIDLYKPNFTLFVAYSAPPRVEPEMDIAMWNRLKIIHFESSFVKEDDR
ncbi:MAG TPA: hypothetical protein PKD85_07625 [Saprospiraceae bacterium]|nr:hypothetical protein [Saprospiraceae bacterium]